jgi:putative ABC transport system ATP-binding protein
MSILEVNHIKKVYKTRMGGEAVTALRDVHFSVEPGEFVAIMGESGSGKTTLLNILASLDTPTAGKVLVDGKDFTTLKDNERAIFRRSNLGFIFQDFNLLDNFSIEDNIKLPLVLAGEDYKKMDAKVEKAARQLGIMELLKKYPYEVSGGQKQRTAIARALITNPRILLADEPTGALDSKAATNLLKQLREINQTGQTILMVTHSNVAASYADRVMFIKDGEVFHQIYRGDMTRSAMLDKICDAVTVLMRGGEDSES